MILNWEKLTIKDIVRTIDELEIWAVYTEDAKQKYVHFKKGKNY